jgi:hypothetical protein
MVVCCGMAIAGTVAGMSITRCERANVWYGASVVGEGDVVVMHGVGRAVEEAVTHFNARRYWHAVESWRTPLLAAEPDEREFFEGLTLVTRGLYHLQNRQTRAARRDLRAGVDRLSRYLPAHAYLVVTEVVEVCRRLLAQLDAGSLPYLIGPVIKYADYRTDADWLLS